MKRRRILLFFLLTLTAVILIYGPLYSQYRDLRERYVKLSSELASVQAQIADLQKEKYLLEHDERYKEKVLRDELGLARPGEEIYKVQKADQ